MTRRLPFVLLLAAAVTTTAAVRSTTVKWPPWISIEAPVNPYDGSARGAILLVHATFREGQSQLSDVSGTAEGLVNGARRTVPIRFETTGTPGVFALRRQWPIEGAWLARIQVRSTTAVVTFDHAGNVASAQVPLAVNANRDQIPREVSARDIDTTLARLARQ